MRRLLGVVGFVLGLFFFSPSMAVTGEQCASCHEIEAESKHHAYHGDCVACHVSSVEHTEAEEARETAPRDARPESVAAGLPTSADCQSCHAKDERRMNFAFGHHDKAGVQCMDCHGNHTPKITSIPAGLERAGAEVALCATCHQDVMTRFNMRSHHPVREGGMACNDCHDPHGGKQLSLVGKTAECTQCHQEVRGPHMYEHAPVAEDCATCHNPHGTPNSKLLALAEPMLCLQCHSVTGNRHGADGTNTNNQVISATALRNCSSCHGAPHGSHMDQHLRF